MGVTMKRSRAMASALSLSAAMMTACGSSSSVQQAPTAPLPLPLPLLLDAGVTEAQPAPPSTTGVGKPEVARPPFKTNVLQAARDNDAYRRVLFTGARTQLALMTIPPGGEIGMEIHTTVEQLIFIVSGEGTAEMDGIKSPVRVGDVVIATPGTRHNVMNTGREPLRLYTVYTPPNHIDGRVQETKAAADADQADHAFGQNFP
jgi:mannose-6-phosphate isomerase-like protein (cupin superfamily)